ncbi:BamA/TamA family outer membrane protein, partial [Parvularcula dongshanensis]
SIQELPGSAPDRTILDVDVTEQSTGSFQIGGGLSSSDNFIINAQLEERNLLGKGQYLLLDLQASSRTRRAQVRFTEPRFLGRNLLAGFSVFANQVDFREAGYTADSIGGGLNVGFPVSDFGRLNLSYQLRNDDIQFDRRRTYRNGIDVLVPGAEVDADGTVDICDLTAGSQDPTCDSVGEYLSSQVGYSLSLNRVNDPFQPSSGFYVSLGQTFAGAGGDVQYLRTQARGAIYKPLPFDLVGAFKVNLGYIDGFGGDDVRLNDRFFAGGNRGFRGFDVAGVGPRYFAPGAATSIATVQNPDTYGRAIGAKAQAIGTLELAIPVPLPEQYGIRAALFTDFGSVGIVDENDKIINQDLRNYGVIGPDGEVDCAVDFNGDGFCDAPVQDDFSLRATAGISINWNSPFGPVQFDIAEPIKSEDYDETQFFRFSAGTQF